MAELKKIMIVAGEASGDTHAAKLIRELRLVANDRELDVFGAAGPQNARSRCRTHSQI